MQRRRTLTISAIPIIAIALVLSAGPAMAAPPQEAPPADTDLSALIANDPSATFVSITEAEQLYGFDATEIAETPEAAKSADPEVTPLSSWWGCDYVGRADYPHVTSNQASVHGYWVRTGGTCPTTATVTVNLQALLCSNVGCTWITQNTDAGKFSSGSGTGKWATPHKTCANKNLVGWRGEVDVNLTDFADPFGYHYGTAKDLSCSPA